MKWDAVRNRRSAGAATSIDGDTLLHRNKVTPVLTVHGCYRLIAFGPRQIEFSLKAGHFSLQSQNPLNALKIQTLIGKLSDAHE